MRDYDGLLAALRARRDELEITHATIDEISGIQSGYASKLLADPPIKGLGGMSFGAVLGALGLQIEIVEDAAGMRQVAGRLQKRRRPKRLSMGATIHIHADYFKQMGALGGQVRRHKLSDKRRKEIATRAARARWRGLRLTSAKCSTHPGGKTA